MVPGASLSPGIGRGTLRGVFGGKRGGPNSPATQPDRTVTSRQHPRPNNELGGAGPPQAEIQKKSTQNESIIVYYSETELYR